MTAEPADTSGAKRRVRGASVCFIEQYLRHREPTRLTALLLAQLDAFNRITTTFGHEHCEEFCSRYAEQLRAALPEKTPVIRLAERRFAVLLGLDSMSAVMDAAVRLTEEQPPQLTVGPDAFLVDVTVGIAVFPSHADDAATLLRRAELALKEAREDELPFAIYRADATRQQAALWKLESELGEAVQRGELDVYFQPKVALDTGTPCGVEALVRWRTKGDRLLSADDFVPLAERTGTIVPMTWLVFDKVLEAAASWRLPTGPFYVAVNVSPQVLVHPQLLPRLQKLHAGLRDAGLALTVELTEDGLVQSEKHAREQLERIRRLEIGLAIDDFGRGYSSLSYLKELPATEVKIDKGFIASIALDPKDRDIVRTIVALAHALEMLVVAEGVDSPEALALVAELGCERAQGFYVARPMRGDRIPDWVATYRLAPSRVRLVSAKG